MLISNGTTFDEGSEVRNATGFIWNFGDFAITEEEWVKRGKPNGLGLFEGIKDGIRYEDTCLTEEFSYTDDNEVEDKDVLIKVEGKSYRCECGCNVFRYLKYVKDKLKCNSCDVTYSVT